MTTETEPKIDPRMVCRACGWGISEGGFIEDFDCGVVGEHVDDLCDGAAYMSAVLEALEPLRPALTWATSRREWCAGSWETGAEAYAPTPHEAVFALATKIGRAMVESGQLSVREQGGELSGVE